MQKGFTAGLLCGRKKKGIFEFLSYPIQLRVSAYTEAGSHRGIAVLGEGEVRSRTHTRPGRPGPGAAAETPPQGHGPPDAALTPVSLSGTQTPASNASTPPSSEGASSHARLSSASSPPRWSPVLFSLHSTDARNVTDTEKNTRLFNARRFTVLTPARLQTNPKRTHTHTHTTLHSTDTRNTTEQTQRKTHRTQETETKSVSGHTQVTPLRGA